jgi:hypothetical protein
MAAHEQLVQKVRSDETGSSCYEARTVAERTSGWDLREATARGAAIRITELRNTPLGSLAGCRQRVISAPSRPGA